VLPEVSGSGIEKTRSSWGFPELGRAGLSPECRRPGRLGTVPEAESAPVTNIAACRACRTARSIQLGARVRLRFGVVNGSSSAGSRSNYAA
jgi:hypothetical protein